MNITRLSQAYDFPGFKALTRIQELPENRASVVITLKRKYQKKAKMSKLWFPKNLLVRPPEKASTRLFLWTSLGIS